MYIDSAYIAKFYLNEPDAGRVRQVVVHADKLISSIWAVAEVTCTFHRKVREGWLTEAEYRELLDGLREHMDGAFWTFAPITERLLRRMAAVMRTLPVGVFLRAGDAIHLTTAADLGEHEIWSNDKHLLAAAPHFGLTGRSV